LGRITGAFIVEASVFSGYLVKREKLLIYSEKLHGKKF